MRQLLRDLVCFMLGHLNEGDWWCPRCTRQWVDH